MTIIKSLSVGNGDMFYIRHGDCGLTMIDCCLSENRHEDILDEIEKQLDWRKETRFISTHPDQDHILGFDALADRIDIKNFYFVKNNVKKPESDDFRRYKQFRESSRAYCLYEGCEHSGEYLGNRLNVANIHCHWPNVCNRSFEQALQVAENDHEGGNTNNISPIISYQPLRGFRFMWMGDLETKMMEEILDDVELSQGIDVLFAPHHGRESGKVPERWLKRLDPKIIVIGEAPSKNLSYYQSWPTITQNRAGDITFVCQDWETHVYVSNPYYCPRFSFPKKFRRSNSNGYYYLGSFDQSSLREWRQKNP